MIPPPSLPRPQYFIFGITIVVVAVPEGLPLAVTISLAYSTQKMMKDNNLVRFLAACETMGGATNICSDKTGTLTENRMTVISGTFAGAKYDKSLPTFKDLSTALKLLLEHNIALNSKAFLVDVEGETEPQFVGNRTECALLVLLRKLGVDYNDVRSSVPVRRLYPFSSEQKMASALVDVGNNIRLYTKGAAEMVLEKCSHRITGTGEIVAMDEKTSTELGEYIVEMAKTGLRTICIAFRDFPLTEPAATFEPSLPPNENLTLCGIVGIKDPVRKEVRRAGVGRGRGWPGVT